MEPKLLEELLKVAVKYGVTKLHTPELQVTLQPSQSSPPIVVMKGSAEAESLLPDKVEISNEDLLFYSSGS